MVWSLRQEVCEVDKASGSSDSLGERLYDLIELHNTGHTHKITGHLSLWWYPLNLLYAIEEVLNMLKNVSLLLLICVHRHAVGAGQGGHSSNPVRSWAARKENQHCLKNIAWVCMNFCALSESACLVQFYIYSFVCVCRQGEQDTNMTESSDSEGESMGEKLFNLVKQIDPTHSADITGELASFSFSPSQCKYLSGKTFVVFTVLHKIVLVFVIPLMLLLLKICNIKY